MVTTDADVTYETQTVRTIRGMESRAIKKWETDGWELVGQTQGRVKTELTFRRPKPKSRRLLWIIGGSALALLLATVITIGTISERNAETAAITEATSAPSSEASPAATQPSASPTMASSAQTESAAPAEAEPGSAVLTPETNPELESLVALTDYCSPDIAAFAAAHRGETVAFPGYVGAMAPHGSAKTRYDFLIGAGDFSETSDAGPAFQFRDVNATNDLKWTGTTPDSIGVGTNLSITATIIEYEQSSCLFLLDPVATAAR